MVQKNSQNNDIPFSVLDLCPIVAGSTAAHAFKNTIDLAQHAEQWGFHRYWVAEHHNMPGIASSATSVVIGYIAGGTSTIRVGSGGIMLPNHAPLMIAEQFGTLESLYPGRIDLGLGRAPGTDQLTARALRRERRGGLEFTDLFDELMDFIHPKQFPNHVRAVPGEGLNIPIWLLGSSDFSAEMAGRLGLPFAFASHFSPEYTLPALERYRESFEPSEFLNTPYAMVGINIIASDTDDRARFLSTSLQQHSLSLVRNRPGQLQPPVEVEKMDELWADYEKLAIERKLSTSIIGSRETVEKKLQTFLNETKADELIINTPIYSYEERLQSYEIVSQIRGTQFK